MMNKYLTLFASLPIAVQCGEVVWSGLFDSSASVADFDKWSFSNPVGAWQWYIHGTAKTSTYLGLSKDFKNPADTSDAQGVRITIDGTAFWEGQDMERSELIPQTSAQLGSGRLFYHFSVKTDTTNAPNPKFEHQLAFFESHFTELKYGRLSGDSATEDNTLRWMVGGQTKWSTDLEASQWYNFAYDIDFDGQTVGLWASNGSAPLTEVVTGVKASTSTNSADWHVGQLRLPNGGTDAQAEDWFWSGVYIEKGPITTSIAGPSAGQGEGASAAAQPQSSAPTTSQVATSQAASASSSTMTVEQASTSVSTSASTTSPAGKQAAATSQTSTPVVQQLSTPSAQIPSQTPAHTPEPTPVPAATSSAGGDGDDYDDDDEECEDEDGEDSGDYEEDC
ncbi:Glycoside Hydrolase Family 131 protein [Penicillium ucsense]|uniref:Glycoside Hydrolase Family 131 protein n=1 Tax=Penicillium ucsense TaxID=2839758 RepID=A0A8J8VYH0_9EURO|nr:Glycoside Hydrolase Family 131 protein [Penicillium ucsense]KAF7731323.1 Glycoside Hydrolase Family 131 protein [Penicillium ucsense]